MNKRQASRRDFMHMSGFGLAGVASFGSGGAFALGSPQPDTVIYNAKIYTVDKRQPTAQALAIKDGRFLAIGSNDEIRGYAGSGTRQLDAGGATIVPGFIDAHIHQSGDRLLYDVVCGNPHEVEFVTIDSIISKLRARAAETPPGEWIQGWFYDDTKIKDGRPLNRLDLDKASTTHPIRVTHRGGHTSVYNSFAFNGAGITRETPNPQGGEFFHDASGLSGVVAERANNLMTKAGKEPVRTEAERRARVEAGAAFFSKAAVERGLTSAQAGSRSMDDMIAFQKLRGDGRLLHRISVESGGALLDAMIANGIKTGWGDEWLRFGATSEHTIDGSFSERTARVRSGYPGISPPYFGISTRSQEELNAWAEKVHKAGIRLNVHANGDMAIEQTLNAYERALKLHPMPNARPKITHCALINDDIIRRMKAIGSVPAIFNTYLYYNSDKFKFYGQELMNRALAFRSFLDAGIPAAAGSDFAPGPFTPLMGIQGVVTRKGWDGSTWGASQRVNVAEALAIHTINGAYAAGEENEKGSISPGKLADFVMLAADPHTVDPDKIINIKILKTFTGGRAVYEA